jgi:cell division protein FtsB
LATQLEASKQQLESENQELLLRKENLQAEIARLNKELDLEIQKHARSKEALNQKLQSNEQEYAVR